VLMLSLDPQALMVINERDSELVHPIRRGMCSGNPRHSDGLDAVASSPRKTCSRARFNSPYGPQLAVSSSCQQFPTELCCCPLEAAEPGQSSNAHRPGTKSVSTQWAMPPALSLIEQVKSLPVIQNPTRSKTRINSPYGPQRAVSLRLS
jgi:hypothetical protein